MLDDRESRIACRWFNAAAAAGYVAAFLYAASAASPLAAAGSQALSAIGVASGAVRDADLRQVASMR